MYLSKQINEVIMIQIGSRYRHREMIRFIFSVYTGLSDQTPLSSDDDIITPGFFCVLHHLILQ